MVTIITIIITNINICGISKAENAAIIANIIK